MTGIPQAGGGKTAANKKTNRDLVNAFDFKDVSL